MISTEYDMEKHNIRSFLADLKSLVKGIVLIANILPILSGFWLALYFTNTSFLDVWDKFLYMTVGGTLVMAGALILNNWYEVDLDREMKRTQQRPTVTGNFSLKAVLVMGITSSILGIVILYFASVEAMTYGFLGWFTYVVLYTFWSKRKYTLNTVIGSVSGAFTPLIGWATVTSAYHIVPIILFIILFIWQIPHTFAIAMRRHDEYKAAKVPMLPVVYGFEITKRQSAVYIACLLPLPLFLTSVGLPFVIITSILNITWLILAIRGLFTQENKKYANNMFYFSLTYLTIVFGMMILITLPIFN
ncbi:heme o synthase [Pseudogracilibacillus sp. SE30717A]|uniref:heme o synthase n=1 Tax=Pseudogracilibacillus sp. SE30717A TaxID=3098293 RepID=UPI00300DE2EF